MEALQGEAGQESKARSIAFQAQRAIWQHQAGEIPYFGAWQNLEKALEASEKLGILWLVAEVGEALVRFLHETGKTENAVVTGLRVFPMVMHHNSPLKVAPFLLVFAKALLDTDRDASLKAVMRLLKRYEKTLDRGLMGIRYYLLLSEMAQRTGKDSSARKHVEAGNKLVEAVSTRLTQPNVIAAFMALPEVRALAD